MESAFRCDNLTQRLSENSDKRFFYLQGLIHWQPLLFFGMFALVLAAFALLVFWLWMRSSVVLFDSVRSVQSSDHLFFAWLWPFWRVLILTDADDITHFAKTQARNNRVSSFSAVLGRGWKHVGASMLGGCDADRHEELAAVFKPAINRAFANCKDAIREAVDDFVDRLPDDVELGPGVFDSLIADVLSLVVFGARHPEVSRFCKLHRKLVLPLLGDWKARLPCLRRREVERVSHFVEVEFAGFLEKTKFDENSVVSQALQGGNISKKEFVHTMYELLFFNVDIGEGEILGLCVELSRHRDLLNDDNVDAFINEAARLHPGVEVSFPEELGEDTVFSGKRFPKGTFVSFDAVKYNLRLGADFNPSRSGTFYRFGLGSRSCAGQSIARFLLRTFLSCVVSRFDFCVLDEAGNSQNRSGLSTMVPSNRFGRIVLKRKRQK